MKTVELESSFMEDIKALLADEETKEKLLRTVRHLKAKLTRQHEAAPAEEEDLTPYTVEELKARIAEGEADIEAGRTYTSKQIFSEIREEFLHITDFWDTRREPASLVRNPR